MLSLIEYYFPWYPTSNCDMLQVALGSKSMVWLIKGLQEVYKSAIGSLEKNEKKTMNLPIGEK